MVEALRKARYSKIDQECLLRKIEQWKRDSPIDNFFFRPKGTKNDTKGNFIKFPFYLIPNR